MKNLKLYIFVTIAMLFWSFSFVWTKIAIDVFPPMTLISSRLILAFVVLFSFVLFTGKFQRVRGEDLKWFFLLALFEPFLYFVGETYGLTMVDPTLASVIIATIPLFAPIFAFFLLKERMGIANVIGILISLSGVLLVIWQPGVGLTAKPLGVLLMFFAVFAAVFYTATIRKISEHYNIFNVILYQNFFGLIYFIPTVLIVDSSKWKNMVLTSDALQAVLMLSIFASVLAFILFAYVIRKIGVAKTNVFANLIPVFTAVISMFVLQTQIVLIQWLGIALTVGGLFFSQIQPKSKTEEKNEEIARVGEY